MVPRGAVGSISDEATPRHSVTIQVRQCGHAARGKPPLPPRRAPYADHLQPIVLVAMNTGLRRSELFHLRWEDIDFEAKWLTVQGVSAKNGQTRRIPLNAEALSILEAWRELAKEGEPASISRGRR